MRAHRPHTTAGAEPELLSPGLVHELRQPLTGLDAGLKLVARELGESVTRLDAWKIATDQLRRLSETLETYQQLMTPGAVATRPFLVDAVVRRAVAGQRHRLEALHERFALVIEQGVPHAHGAPQALHHAVMNLVANAVDALDGRPGGRIEVRVRPAPGAAGRAEVRVADSGVGIPPSLRRRLFTRRFTTKPPGAGAGLGLAIARRMMRASGGEVRLAEDDDPGRRPWSRTELVVDLAAGPDAPVPHAPDPPRRAAARAVPVALATAVAVVLVAGVLAGWTALQRWMRVDAAAVPVVAATAADDVVEVAGTVGAVERLRAGAWETARAGERLREDDTLRTAPGANATIAVGDRSRLVVSESTQLTVREMTAAVHRLRLSRGRISVDHQPDGARVVVVESEHGETVARAAAARFSVLASGSAVAVATERGVVRLQAAGRAVDVAGGEQAVSFRGAAPERAARIPVELLLEIARSASLGDGTCGVEGRAEPGAEVRVEGRVVEPGPDGRFAARVPVARGERTVRLVTRDAAGRIRERRVPCTRPADPAVVSDFAVRWGQE